MISDFGLNDMLNVYLKGTTQTTAYYVGFIDSTSFSGIASSDTPSSHPGWIEYTDYAETTRPVITFGTPSAGVENNPIAVEITPNAAHTIVGWFIASASGKGVTTGIMPFLDTFIESTRNTTAGVKQRFTVTITLKRQ